MGERKGARACKQGPLPTLLSLLGTDGGPCRLMSMRGHAAGKMG